LVSAQGISIVDVDAEVLLSFFPAPRESAAAGKEFARDRFLETLEMICSPWAVVSLVPPASDDLSGISAPGLRLRYLNCPAASRRESTSGVILDCSDWWVLEPKQ
jgi:hypothetical protein